jgi:hypothetical protein
MYWRVVAAVGVPIAYTVHDDESNVMPTEAGTPISAGASPIAGLTRYRAGVPTFGTGPCIARTEAAR